MCSNAEGDVGGKGRRFVALHHQQLEAVGEGVLAYLVFQRLGDGGCRDDEKQQPCGAEAPQ